MQSRCIPNYFFWLFGALVHAWGKRCFIPVQFTVASSDVGLRLVAMVFTKGSETKFSPNPCCVIRARSKVSHANKLGDNYIKLWRGEGVNWSNQEPHPCSSNGE
jgi:hypothetical protein